MEKWRSFMPAPDTFNDQFYNDFSNKLKHLEQPRHVLNNQENNITLQEVDRVISHAKNHEAIGIENSPYEIFKNK